LQLIASGLDRASYEPIVVLPARGELASDLESAGIEVLVRPVAVLRRELATPRGLASVARAAARDARELKALIRRRGVALVHSNTSVVLGGAAAATRARVPHIWHVREIYSRFGHLWPVYRRLLLSATALPCVSHATAKQFRGAGRVRVIPDGLAIDARRAPRSEARRALGLSADVPVIAVLGRISDWKGQDVLVRALAEPGLRDLGTLGLLAGEPWPGAVDRLAAVQALAASLGVSDRLRLLGFRDDVETVYGAADIIAVPSVAPDPLPGAAIEAAAAGCAVIASRHGGLPEIVRDGETGCLITPGDHAALARAAVELLQHPSQRERLGASAAVDVRQRFGRERLQSAILALYNEIV
jgi:glycosyltransferase involved in cell wall biosynthesis